jgi:DNA repair protein RecO (recombination protein O)
LFEFGFLRALGYGLELDRDIRSGEPLQAEGSYLFELENGPMRVSEPASDHEGFRGRDLISLREQVLDDADSLRAAKRLLARALNSYLGDRPLKSRGVFKDIVDRGLGR